MAATLHIVGIQRDQPLPEYAQIPLSINGLGIAFQSLSRGAVVELTGAASSGRASLVNSFLADATTLGEVSAVVDVSNSFDPASAAQAGVDLKQILWVQCNGRLDHAMKVADLILHGGGFGLVVLDLCEVPVRSLQRVPISYWHRFRLAVKNTPTALVVAGNQANARSCAIQQIEVETRGPKWTGAKPFQMLGSLNLCLHSRKPVAREAAELRALAAGE